MEIPYKQIFEAVPGYLTVQNRELLISAANERFIRDFGDFEGRYCYQVYKQRPERCEDCPVERTFRDGQRHTSREKVKCLNGDEVSVIVYTKPVLDDEGKIIAVIELSTDITEIIQLQQQLKESQERYRVLFEEVPCYISIQDENLRIIDANRKFREDFGPAYGNKCYEVYKHRTEECFPCVLRETLDDGKMYTHEEVVTSLNGDKKNVLVHTTPIKNANGEITSAMEMSADITQIRQLQSQLTSIGMLISSISHGLKGLLNGLDGGVYLVNSGLEKGNDERINKGWSIVLRNISRIRSMVMDILYYAKDREPQWERISINDIFVEVYNMVERKSSDHNVKLICEREEKVGYFKGDYKAIRTLLVNLLENSFDACRLDRKKEEHFVRFSVEELDDIVRFTIEDNGLGMDRESQEKAFSLFFSSKGAEGTGLGLYISNKIAQSHGGSIDIASKAGLGTKFTVTLPIQQPAESKQEEGTVES